MVFVSHNKGLNSFGQICDTSSAQAAQSFLGQDAEPDLRLVQPTGRSGREVKMHVRMLGQPRVILPVCAVVVQNDVQLPDPRPRLQPPVP